MQYGTTDPTTLTNQAERAMLRCLDRPPNAKIAKRRTLI